MAPCLPRPKSGGPKSGHPQVVERREVVHAIFYILPATSEAMIYVAMIHLMIHRLRC